MAFQLPKETVRAGYDAVSHLYRGDDADSGQYGPWIRDLLNRVPDGAAVLDLGCGCGVPTARDLATAGSRVTGVDFSPVQITRAREAVPGATFLQADASEVGFPDASFDAVVCLYTLIHLPLDEQPPLLARIARWLRPGGWFLSTTGHSAWTGSEDDWLGGGARMWWSHADAATCRAWITDAGLVVDDVAFVPEGASGHALFWAQKPMCSAC